MALPSGLAVQQVPVTVQPVQRESRQNIAEPAVPLAPNTRIFFPMPIRPFLFVPSYHIAPANCNRISTDSLKSSF
jgi:hypothetical protein